MGGTGLSGLATISLARRNARSDRARRRRQCRRWTLEILESRTLLSATIYTVNSTGNDTTGSGNTGTLPYVVGQANANPNTDGSEIEFDPSVFSTPQTIMLASTLTLSETAGPEVIDGPGSSLATVSGNNAVEVFSITGGVTASISGLTITSGVSSTSGGGINNAGALTVNGSTVSYNSTAYPYIGGGIYNTGTLTLTDSTVASNTAADGGGIANSGLASLSDCVISGNSSAGAASFLDSGGGIRNSGELSMVDCLVSGNTATFGGGIANGGTLAISESTIEENQSTEGGSGGGISSYGNLQLTDSLILNNRVYAPQAEIFGNSDAGGGLALSGTATIWGVTISGNSVQGQQGGVMQEFLWGSSGPYIEAFGFPGGNGSGGGIYSNADLTLVDSTISGNSALGGNSGMGGYQSPYQYEVVVDHQIGGYAYGGGLTVGNGGGTTVLANVTISGNMAVGGLGGGNRLYTPAGQLIVYRPDFDSPSYGGGIENEGSLAVVNTTIAYNSIPTGHGGGLHDGITDTTLDNTIVALNSNGAGFSDDISLFSNSTTNAAVTGAYNLIGTGGSGGLTDGQNGNHVGVAGQFLGPLADNGGPTQTIALETGSVAIDGGSNALAIDPTTGLTLADDQRGGGFSRIVNGTVDIGAYERKAKSPGYRPCGGRKPSHSKPRPTTCAYSPPAARPTCPGRVSKNCN